MPLLYKPHTIVVTRLSEETDEFGNIVNTGDYEEISTIKGQITIKESSDLKSMPAMLLIDLSDGGERNKPSIRIGDRLEAIGFKWNVDTPLEFHESQGATNHCRCGLNRNKPDSENNENV